MKLKIVALFYYHLKNYMIYLFNDEICYGYQKKGQIYTDLSDEEKMMMDTVYEQIRVEPKTSFFCGNYRIEGKSFKLFLDRRNLMYSFILEDETKNKIPTKEQLAFFNTYYNSQTEVCYSKTETEQKNPNKVAKFFKRFIKIGATSVAILIASELALNALPKQTLFDMNYHLNKAIQKDLTTKDKEYTFEDVIKSIDRNDSITNQDKAFLKETLEEEFEENKEYIDIEKILKRLEGVTVKDYNSSNNGILGSYHRVRNRIRIYDSINRESTLFHEINHLLARDGSFDSKLKVVGEIGSKLDGMNLFEEYSASVQAVNENYLAETIDELFTREYLEKYQGNHTEISFGNAYEYEMPYIYALAEILPEETLREFKYNVNTNIIIDKLAKMDHGDLKKACELITSINSIQLYGEKLDDVIEELDLHGISDEIIDSLPEKDREKYRNAENEMMENYRRIHDSIAYFYQLKTGKNMSDDMVMLLYFYNHATQTEEERQKINDFFQLEEREWITKITPKGYVSKSYQKKHPNVTVNYSKNHQDFTVEIDSQNRFLEEDEREK